MDYEPECPDCKTNQYVTEKPRDGEYVCKRCGRTLQRYIVSEEQEWRTFKDKDSRGGDPNRVGGPEEEGAILGLSMGKTPAGSDFNPTRLPDKEERAQMRLQNAYRQIVLFGERLELTSIYQKRVTKSPCKIKFAQNIQIIAETKEAMFLIIL
mmetsp:Transcript_11909/g.16647  ORF Transcript_11909/g.16647 Transcript_11909/m.16647 type:complete len:153 (-) Transcript_11909:723-1181(-)